MNDEQFLVIPTPLLPSLCIEFPVIVLQRNLIHAKMTVSVEISHEMLALGGTVRFIREKIEDEVIRGLRDAMAAERSQYYKL